MDVVGSGGERGERERVRVARTAKEGTEEERDVVHVYVKRGAVQQQHTALFQSAVGVSARSILWTWRGPNTGHMTDCSTGVPDRPPSLRRRRLQTPIGERLLCSSGARYK